MSDKVYIIRPIKDVEEAGKALSRTKALIEAYIVSGRLDIITSKINIGSASVEEIFEGMMVIDEFEKNAQIWGFKDFIEMIDYIHDGHDLKNLLPKN